MDFWFNALILSSQYNPPRFIEMVMVLLALVMLVVWTFIPDIPYMVLGWSFVVGASLSILVREAIAPSPEMRANQIVALVFLSLSFYGFAYIFQNF